MRRTRQEIYEVYCTDMLLFIARSRGLEYENRYYDLAYNRAEEKKEPTAEETVAKINSRLRVRRKEAADGN